MALIERYVDKDVVGGLGDGTSWANAYSSLNAWEAGEEDDLPTAGNSHLVHCRASSGSADTFAFIIEGWGTGASNTITIQGNVEDFKWDSTKYHMSLAANDGAGIEIREHYVIIDKLQITHAGTTNTADVGIKVRNSNKYETIKNNIIKGGYNGIYMNPYSDDRTIDIYNNLVYDAAESGINCADTTANNVSIYNNTVCYCNHTTQGASAGGIRVQDTAITGLQNNLCYDNYNADFADAADSQGDYNFSKDTTANGSNSLTSQADPFEDYTNDDFHLSSGSNPIGAGADLSAYFTTDLEGETRSSWDIGADEFSGGGASSIIPLVMHNYRQLRMR